MERGVFTAAGKGGLLWEAGFLLWVGGRRGFSDLFWRYDFRTAGL